VFFSKLWVFWIHVADLDCFTNNFIRSKDPLISWFFWCSDQKKAPTMVERCQKSRGKSREKSFFTPYFFHRSAMSLIEALCGCWGPYVSTSVSYAWFTVLFILKSFDVLQIHRCCPDEKAGGKVPGFFKDCSILESLNSSNRWKHSDTEFRISAAIWILDANYAVSSNL
jgi:hypothetical protein